MISAETEPQSYHSEVQEGDRCEFLLSRNSLTTVTVLLTCKQFPTGCLSLNPHFQPKRTAICVSSGLVSLISIIDESLQSLLFSSFPNLISAFLCYLSFYFVPESHLFRSSASSLPLDLESPHRFESFRNFSSIHDTSDRAVEDDMRETAKLLDCVRN